MIDQKITKKLLEDEEKLEKDITTRLRSVQGVLSSMASDPEGLKKKVELTMELQACIGALEAIKRLAVIEHLIKAGEHCDNDDADKAHQAIDEAIQILSRKTTSV